MKTRILGSLAILAIATSGLAQVGQPQDAGLTPRTATLEVNTNYNNNALETGDISITSNGNIVMAFEDDNGSIPLQDFEAVWTLFDNQGNLLTPPATVTNIAGSLCIATAESLPDWTFRAFFRSNGSLVPGYTGDFGGKAKGNQFGNGFGFMAGCDAIGCEVPELLNINVDAGGTATGGSPITQLLNNDGSRNTAAGGPDVAGIRSFSDPETEPAGTIRPGDFDYLANGNLVIVGESRQVDDRALTGQGGGNVVVYKVFNSAGGVVKAYSAASSEASGQDMWHGTAATANGFAIRFNVGTERIRLFDNNGNPVTTNIDLAAVTGHPEAGAGGRGDGTGFKSNGKDAYVYAAQSASGPWVTVLNADGTVRYSRAVTETNELGAYANGDRLDAAIAEDGRVIVAFDASNNDTNNTGPFRLTQARVFDPCGNPGPVFYVSERENGTNAVAGNSVGRPRVAWRGNTIAVMWGSQNSPNTLAKVLALRLFTPPPPTFCGGYVGQPQDAGLTPRTATLEVNTNYNNNALETGDISITSNGNIVLAFEDDNGSIPLQDFEAVWTLYDNQGNLLTPPATVTNIAGTPCIATAESLPNWTFRAFFRSNGSLVPGYTGDFGGKAKGNQFGNGFGFMAGCDAIGCEVPELLNINVDGGGAETGGSPITQLLNNDGSRNTAAGGPDVAGIRSFSDAETEPSGTIRPGDFDYLANGNLVIAGESRQVDDRALTGQGGGNVVVYKVFNSAGGVVKAYSAASSEASGQDMWHGTAATANGFAIRFNVGTERIRLFDNNGNPVTTNINLAAVTGHPEAGAGGRGDGTGFKSNGKDAYVYAAQSASGPWVTVLNANGTVRYSRAVTETNELGAYANGDRLDAAIAEDGRVIVAFDASNNDTNNTGPFRLTQARVFDPCGNPLGPVFYVSERENGTNAVAGNSVGRPRVAWRGNTIAVMWASQNSPNTLAKVLALRLFTPPPSSGPTIKLESGNVIISWTDCGVLQQSSDLVAWADIVGAVSSYSTPATAAKKFYRLRY